MPEWRTAIRGGEKAVTMDQEAALHWPLIGEKEKTRVLEVLDMGSGVAGEGWYTEAYRFEEEFGSYLETEYALCHVNGTAAIHAALFALGIGSGDEVITPSYTYWASCMPILCWNAVPVFADVDPKTLTIDPADIERRITPRTKAIIAVHLWGMPCEMGAILEIARKHDVKVIEDAAQAQGAEYKGKKAGTIGDIGCFSFQASKNLPAIEGGMLVTGDREYYERAVALGHYERIKDLPEDSHYRKYSATCFGYKYRIHPLSAAIGRVQLRYLDERNQARDRNIEYVNSRLGELPGIEVLKIPEHIKRIYYQYEIIYNQEELGVSKELFVAALQAEGVRASGERYSLQHQQPAYRQYGINPSGPLPVSERLIDKIVALPTFPWASTDLLDQYVEAFRKVITYKDELKDMA